MAVCRGVGRMCVTSLLELVCSNLLSLSSKARLPPPPFSLCLALFAGRYVGCRQLSKRPSECMSSSSMFTHHLALVGSGTSVHTYGICPPSGCPRSSSPNIGCATGAHCVSRPFQYPIKYFAGRFRTPQVTLRRLSEALRSIDLQALSQDSELEIGLGLDTLDGSSAESINTSLEVSEG